MATTFLTKQGIAKSFKHYMEEYPIKKITIKMITDKCRITRHTFYNHFRDIYDLLGWIYENEVLEELDQCCNLNDWKNGLRIVLDYTYTNKKICSNTCKSLGREHLERFLHNIFKKVILGVIGDIEKEYHCEYLSKENLASFYSYAITGEFLQWITDGFKEEITVLHNRICIILDGNIRFLIKSY